MHHAVALGNLKQRQNLTISVGSRCNRARKRNDFCAEHPSHPYHAHSQALFVGSSEGLVGKPMLGG